MKVAKKIHFRTGKKTKFIDVSNLQIVQHFIEYGGRNVPFTLLTYQVLSYN